MIRPTIAILLVLFMGSWGVRELRANYEYNNTIGSYWDLSVKASTLQQKSTYLDQYVAALSDQSKFSSHNAIIFPTPNNSYEQNMVALKSLQGRMHQIQGMDEQSFAYQTAIQQITAQEQGEAAALTSTFEGCWYLSNYPTLWDWIDGIFWFGPIILLAGIGIWYMIEND